MAEFPLTSNGGGWSNPTCLKCGQVSTQVGGGWALTPASGGLLMDENVGQAFAPALHGRGSVQMKVRFATGGVTNAL